MRPDLLSMGDGTTAIATRDMNFGEDWYKAKAGAG
jgi:hypothetical protein